MIWSCYSVFAKFSHLSTDKKRGFLMLYNHSEFFPEKSQADNPHFLARHSQASKRHLIQVTLNNANAKQVAVSVSGKYQGISYRLTAFNFLRRKSIWLMLPQVNRSKTRYLFKNERAKTNAGVLKNQKAQKPLEMAVEEEAFKVPRKCTPFK